MLTHSRLHLLATLLTLGVGCFAPHAVAGVSISPVVLEIDSPRKAIAVKVTNNGDQPITYQVDAVTWTQKDGLDHTEPTDDLLVVPPIVTVRAGVSQIFRVMLRDRASSPVERTYRVILEDITKPQALLDGQAVVAFKLTHNLPVLIAPSGKILNALRWKPCGSDALSRTAAAVSGAAGPPSRVNGSNSVACVRILNAGNRRVKVQTLTVSGEGWQQTLAINDGGINILAGAEREWRIPLPSDQINALRGVSILTVRNEALQAVSGGF